MKLIRNAIAVALFGATATVAACSNHGSTGPGTGNGGGNGPIGINQAPNDGTGRVGANLTIQANGAHLYALNWTIGGSGLTTYTGTVHIADAESIEFAQGGILAGNGYTVSMSGSDTAGDPCSGTSGAFNVAAGGVTQVSLLVTCTIPSDATTLADVNTGTVFVDAGLNVVTLGPTACPGITGLSADPGEIPLGATTQLTLGTTGPASVITWSVTPAGGGTFSSTSSANPTFQCTSAPAQVAVTGSVALVDSGACNGAMFTSISVVINCEGSGIVCQGGTTACGPDGGQTCVNTSTDVNNCGSCGNVCPSGDAGGTRTCTSGVCGIQAQPTVACTSSPCAANTVQCTNVNANGVCSQTEQVIVAYDILKNAQGPGAPKATSSSANFPNCLASLSFVPRASNTNAPNGHCTNPVTEPAFSDPNAAVGNCFFGTNTGSACLTAGNANGPCVAREQTDLASTDPTFINGHFTDPTIPGGVGNAVLNCAQTAITSATSNCNNCFL